MKKTIILLFALLAAGILRTPAEAQEIDWTTQRIKGATPEEWQRVLDFMEQNERRLAKATGSSREIRSLIIRGNKITTVVYNYGTITRPNTLGNVADLVWNRLGYGFEFTPLVGAAVTDITGRPVTILNDGNWLAGQGGYSPDGTVKWGWLPKAGYAASGQNDIAAWSHRADVAGDLTRKPHSWPETWYNNALGRYVWPAFLGNDATSPDEEAYFVVDDYTNAKYQYYPFPDDSTKRGLGLDMECRFFQFNNPLAEDIIFLVYRVTNRSPKTLDEVYFGMYGDPHVGGPSDYGDDRAYFIPPKGPLADPFNQRARSMVYAWDDDGTGDGGLTCGYFGFKFLESPTNSVNMLDDDDDGIVDESPYNEPGAYIDGIALPLTYGIADTAKYVKQFGRIKPRWSGDEDGDWDVEKDDVGIDGIAGTGDVGEGNKKPDVGYDATNTLVSEPHFGIRDVDESDQIGLTSFNALAYTDGVPNVPKNDVFFYEMLSSDSIAIDQELFRAAGDNVFLYGSGPFSLAPSGTQRFSISLMMGENLPDLLLNAETAQRVLEANYLFAQPPPKPVVTAIPGDGRVTLYWDNNAEATIDPLTATRDFEGYKIYRSEDYSFADVYTITDANGAAFLPNAMLDATGKRAQFDLVNAWSGLHPVEYAGRGVKYQLGGNTGLVHEFVDSTVTNGKTYYYAVASYDHGFDSLGVALPPTESQIAITKDPVTSVLTFDMNTVSVVPGPLPAGQTKASVDNNFQPQLVKGISTGSMTVKVMEDAAVIDNAKYNIDFRTNSGGKVVYDIQSLTPRTDEIVSRDTVYVPLSRKNIILSTVTVTNAAGGTVDPSLYRIDGPGGRIRGNVPGNLTRDEKFKVSYLYNTVFESNRLASEDDNPVFDGMRVYVKDDPLGIDSLNSGWANKNNTNLLSRVHKTLALPTAPFRPAPLDFQIQWNNTDTTARGKWAFPGDTLLNNSNRKVVVCPFRIINMTDTSKVRILVDKALTDSMWRPGREIVFVTPPKYAPQSPIPVMLSVTFSAPAGEAPILPTQGNVFEVKTTKPFAAGDQYSFTSTSSKFDAAQATNALDQIRVVPNPYVGYSDVELPGVSSIRRGENRLQFRNLPPKCTIRIYSLVGELVDTIVKDDSNSYADWRILSYEGQRIAYGVYIYHVDVPGVGEKIGRLALIK